jgi:hypothetical protein
MRETTSIIPYLEHPYSIAVVCRYRSALTDVNRNGKLIRRRCVAVQMRTKNGGQSTQKEPKTTSGQCRYHVRSLVIGDATPEKVGLLSRRQMSASDLPCQSRCINLYDS